MISVIIPIYNSEQYLAQCLESILCQTYKDFELLLIDDGSTDNSCEICNHYANIDSRIRVFHIENKGVSNARNLGVDKSVGEWITFIDSDDWISEDYLMCLQRDKSTDSLNILQAYRCINKSYDAWPVKYKPGSYVWEETNQIDNLLIYGTPWGKLYNSLIIKKNNIKFDTTISSHEDHIFYFTYLLYVKHIYVCDGGIYYYRINNVNSLSRKMPDSSLLLYAYDSLKSVYNKLLLNNHLDTGVFPYMQHFLFYIKIKAVRSAFYNENSREDRIKVLSSINRKELYKEYRCKTLNAFMMKVVLLMPNDIRLSLLHLLRKFLRS